MSTYSYDKVLSDYVNGRMDVEMAMGHGLQHIGKLYTAQTAANLNHYGLRDKVDTLEKTIETLQNWVVSCRGSGSLTQVFQKWSTAS